MESITAQGHGIAGRFAGLPDTFADSDHARIAILPVAFDQTTTYAKGSDKGPEALIEASRNLELYDIETGSEVYQLGIHTSSVIKPQSSEEMLELVYKAVQSLLKNQKFVITLGGEHSISFASVKAASEIFPSLTILQLDAHSDLINTYEGNSFSHACVMARIKELPNVTKIVSVGIRSMSREEADHIDKNHTFFAHDIHKCQEWIDHILPLLSGYIYITLDLDVFDSSLMPATGTPEPGGLGWYQVTDLLREVFMHKNVIGFDMVELCPQPGHHAAEYLAAKLLYKMLSYKFWKEVPR